MVSTGIPELRCEEDIDYLREAFSLDISEEEAGMSVLCCVVLCNGYWHVIISSAKKFMKLINESLSTKATQLNFAIHILANPVK